MSITLAHVWKPIGDSVGLGSNPFPQIDLVSRLRSHPFNSHTRESGNYGAIRAYLVPDFSARKKVLETPKPPNYFFSVLWVICEVFFDLQFEFYFTQSNFLRLETFKSRARKKERNQFFSSKKLRSLGRKEGRKDLIVTIGSEKNNQRPPLAWSLHPRSKECLAPRHRLRWHESVDVKCHQVQLVCWFKS